MEEVLVGGSEICLQKTPRSQNTQRPVTASRGEQGVGNDELCLFTASAGFGGGRGGRRGKGEGGQPAVAALNRSGALAMNPSDEARTLCLLGIL